jgi:hypothetical protein
MGIKLNFEGVPDGDGEDQIQPARTAVATHSASANAVDATVVEGAKSPTAMRMRGRLRHARAPTSCASDDDVRGAQICRKR